VAVIKTQKLKQYHLEEERKEQKGGTRKGNKGINMIKIHHIHAWKYHKETLLCTINIH
jgi:hypothetical protein